MSAFSHAQESVPLDGEHPYVDDLDLRNAVISDGLLLQGTEEGLMVIYALAAGRARLIGAFEDVGEALQALDIDSR